MDLGIAYLGAAIGAGLVTIGTGYGIGKIASSAMDGMARQPEAAGKIQTGMIIACALIEGVAFFTALAPFTIAGTLADVVKTLG
ncbi:MAG: F0F1 ATP synthase subunit C [Candidatus Delongbacteria bacterium]|nr:MAG: F0F1 ATP synthase subunit C [Candidatus Delongbacteria bacterium]